MLGLKRLNPFPFKKAENVLTVNMLVLNDVNVFNDRSVFLTESA